MEFFCLCNGPFYQKRMLFLEKCVQSFILSLKNYEVGEGDTIFPQDNGTLFQNVYNIYIYIHDPFDVLSEIIWISLRAEGISFGKYPLQK